jgi:hypothetical protein
MGMFTRLIFRKPFQVARAAMVEIELYVALRCPAQWQGRAMLRRSRFQIALAI